MIILILLSETGEEPDAKRIYLTEHFGTSPRATSSSPGAHRRTAGKSLPTMLHLGISVSLANILLFLFTEVFVVLMGFHATRLAARYLLHSQLADGKKVPLTTSFSIVDMLPYNSDLQPVGGFAKLLLTLCRLGVIAVSVYVGATLDGEVTYKREPFNVSYTIDVAHPGGRMLTDNNGLDRSAVTKISCLRLINDHRGTLYKGYMAGSTVVCEDGLATFSSEVLLDAEIKDGAELDTKGLSLKGMPILGGEAQEGVKVSNTSIVYKRMDEDSNSSTEEDSCYISIKLLERKNDGKCVFGVHRSKGRGFHTPITLNVTTICDLQVLNFSRMLSTKPEFMPPGISFLLQLIDGVIVTSVTKHAPIRKADSVMAMISVPGLATAMIVAMLATGFAIGLWVALRMSDVKSDFTSVKGVAELWGEEKFGCSNRTSGDDSALFVALENEGKTAYLGSMDDASEGDWKNGQLELQNDVSFPMSASEASSGNFRRNHSQKPAPPESDAESPV